MTVNEDKLLKSYLIKDNTFNIFNILENMYLIIP